MHGLAHGDGEQSLFLRLGTANLKDFSQGGGECFLLL